MLLGVVIAVTAHVSREWQVFRLFRQQVIVVFHPSKAVTDGRLHGAGPLIATATMTRALLPPLTTFSIEACSDVAASFCETIFHSDIGHRFMPAACVPAT